MLGHWQVHGQTPGGTAVFCVQSILASWEHAKSQKAHSYRSLMFVTIVLCDCPPIRHFSYMLGAFQESKGFVTQVIGSYQ